MRAECERIATILHDNPGRWADEQELHLHLAELLMPSEGFAIEHPGDAGRYDLYRPNDRLVVEVKTKGSRGQVLRQLIRYADSPDVAGLVLATTKANLGVNLPRELRGKPLVVARLWLWGLR